MQKKGLLAIILGFLILFAASCNRDTDETADPDSPVNGAGQEAEGGWGFDYVNQFSEGFASVYKIGEGGWGYIDTTGKLVVPHSFNLAAPYTGGVAIVSISSGDEDRPYLHSLLNANGELLAVFDYIYIGEFSEGLAVVTTIVEVEEDDQQNEYEWHGFIDKNGKIAIPCEFDQALDFSEGLAAVSIDYLFGYIDKSGETVIPFAYEQASSFSEGLAAVYSQGKYGFIDATGKVVIPIKFDYAGSFREGLAMAAKSEDGDSAKWGYIDKTGRTAIPFEFAAVSDFVDGIGFYEGGKRFVEPKIVPPVHGNEIAKPHMRELVGNDGCDIEFLVEGGVLVAE